MLRAMTLPVLRTMTGPRTHASAAASDGVVAGLRRLYRYFSRRRRVQLALLGGLMLVGAVAELVTIGAVLPFLALIADPAHASTMPLLRGLFALFGWRAGSDVLVPAALLFAAVALTAGAIRLLLTWAGQKFVYRLGHDLGVEVYRRTLYQPYAYHIARNSSVLIADINKVQLVVGGMLMPLMQAATALVISCFILAGLIAIDARTALLAAAGFGALYLGVSLATRRRLAANSRVIAKAQTDRVRTVQEGLGGIRDVLIDQAQPVYVANFSRIDSAYRDAQTVNAFIGAAPRFIIEAAGMVMIAFLALVLSRGAGGLAGALPVLGALALGALALAALLPGMDNGNAQILGTRPHLRVGLTVLEQPMPAPPPAGPPLPFAREIALERLGFRYRPGAPMVLENVNLTIPKGSRVGIVGKTGSGKSTLMDVIMGLLQPAEGAVRVDGEAVSAANVGRWQARIAHVPQSIYLSDSSIAENIAFAVPLNEIDEARLRAVARQAAIADFIDGLPEGYASFVGERGVRLSGGQRQRIGIARALYKQADILVFDEATSALDSETEAAVMAAIDGLSPDLTVVIIAHRLTTIEACDMIVRLDGGRAVAAAESDAKLARGEPVTSEANRTDFSKGRRSGDRDPG